MTPMSGSATELWGTHDFIIAVIGGGLAVVPRTNGTHELWVARDPDAGGISIYAMTAGGVLLFTNGPIAHVVVPAASGTMTYDPHAHRVLYANEGDGQVYAMAVETRTIARTYSIPVEQRKFGVTFTGLTSGPGGMSEFRMTVNGMMGVSCVVQATTNLAMPDWEHIVTNAAPFEFTEPATRPACLYRAVPESSLVREATGARRHLHESSFIVSSAGAASPRAAPDVLALARAFAPV